MTALLLLSLFTLIAGVGFRQLAVLRLKRLDGDLRDIDRVLEEQQGVLAGAAERRRRAEAALAQLKSQVDTLQAERDKLNRELQQVRDAPVTRYFTIDRRRAQPGVIWTVSVTHPASTDRVSGERVYLVVARSAEEATERTHQRFPRAAGHQVTAAAPCPLFETPRDAQERQP